ncbi:hypothetical protein MRY82_00790 [bacterium]|nr:hypothetical protein [bacterium]
MKKFLLSLAILISLPSFAQDNDRVYISGSSAKAIFEALQTPYQQGGGTAIAGSDSQVQILSVNEIINSADNTEYNFVSIEQSIQQHIKPEKRQSAAGLICFRAKSTYHCFVKENLGPFAERDIFEALSRSLARIGMNGFATSGSSDADSYSGSEFTIGGYNFCKLEKAEEDKIIVEYRFTLTGETSCEEDF